MNNKKHLQDETNYLFNIDFNNEDLTEDQEDEYLNHLENLLKNYTWNEIFTCWFDYLKNNCKSDNDILNWANIFFWYDGHTYPIPNTFDFLGYLYYRIDVTKNMDAQHIFDSIAIPILEKLGEADIVADPCFAPESHPKIKQAVDKWRQKENV